MNMMPVTTELMLAAYMRDVRLSTYGVYNVAKADASDRYEMTYEILDSLTAHHPWAMTPSDLDISIHYWDMAEQAAEMAQRICASEIGRHQMSAITNR